MAAGAAMCALAAVSLGAMFPGVADAAVVFDAKPPADTNQTSGTFRFHDSSGATSFQCKLDSAANFTACNSPVNLSGLSEGQHSFSVRGATGAAPPPPSTYTWTVDLTPPTTQVTSQPPALTNSSTATFTFTSPDSTATFRCSLNGSAPTACTSPVVYSGLADATRSLLIEAVDPAGNVDPTAQPIIWTVDTTPPDTTLASPGKVIADPTPVFSFTSTEPGSTFQCSFDNAAFSACSSPIAEAVPHSGHQRFEVRAIDPVGNIDPTPAVYTWTADITPPKRPKVTIFPAPTAGAGRLAPLPVAQSHGPSVTFTNPLSKLLSTPTFTIALRLQAQWSSDSTAKSFDVTVNTVPQDSTGMDPHGDNLVAIEQFSHTKRTALKLRAFAGSTVCVKAEAIDKYGNTSAAHTACTTVPVSFTPRDVGPQPVKDPKAWRGYYIVLGAGGYEFEQEIGDEFFFSPRHAAIVAERCGHCGVVEFDFARFGGHKLHPLATVNLDSSDKSGDFHLINVSLPVRRLDRDGEGLLVMRAASGRPRIAGIGLSS